MQAQSFDHILELVETLSDDEQQTLIRLLQQRRVERRRDEIAANIARANADYQQGEVFRGTVDEMMAELHQ